MIEKVTLENKASKPATKTKAKPKTVKVLAKKTDYLYHYTPEEGETYIEFVKGEEIEIPERWVDSVVARGIIDKPKKV